MKHYIPADQLPKCSICSYIWDDYRESACFCRMERDVESCPGPDYPEPVKERP
jgi:hypothetical protein